MDKLEWQLLEDREPVDEILIDGIGIRAGDRVRLHPCGGGDILDLALTGKEATIESIEQDYEDNVHIAVVIEDDPGRDFGMLRQPGHRFFFTPTEIELLTDRNGA